MRTLIALLVSLILAGFVGFAVHARSLATNPDAPIAANCLAIAAGCIALLVLTTIIRRQASG